MPHTEPPDEQLQLQIDRANARSRMKETHETILKLKQILKAYESDYNKWYNRYNNADLKLAEIDGRLKKLKEHRVTPEKTSHEIALTLTREQIEAIALKIGMKVEFDKGGEELEEHN